MTTTGQDAQPLPLSEPATPADSPLRAGHRGSRYIAPILATLLIWFLIRRFAEAETVARTLARGHWQWLAAAAASQACGYVFYALDCRTAFRAIGVSARMRDLLPTVLATLVVGEIAPLGWAAGAATFVRYATRNPEGSDRAGIGVLLAQAADLTAFSTVFAVGTIVLFLRHDLSPAVIAGGATLVLMNLALGTLLALALRHPDTASALLRRLPHAGVRAERLTAGLIEAANEIRQQPRLPGAFAAAVASHTANVTALYLVFMAFSQPVDPGTLIAGYGIGTLAWMLSPIPSGVGMVEGAVALVFTSLGIPAGSAAVIAIAYRGISFWLPIITGAVCLRSLERRQVTLHQGNGGSAGDT